jgi:hypothetical protein
MIVAPATLALMGLVPHLVTLVTLPLKGSERYFFSFSVTVGAIFIFIVFVVSAFPLHKPAVLLHARLKIFYC